MLRRRLPWILLLSAALHVLGMVRSELPAQDGLKFLRVARRFQDSPWTDVVRGSDQHPLYPATVAAVEPIVRAAVGRGPDAWRIAAQTVSVLASVLLLVPLSALARRLFDEPTALLAAFLWAVLPLPGLIGHDTLSDPLALLAFAVSFSMGARALSSDGGWASAIGCGLSAGVGYLARPEVVLAPIVIAAVGMGRSFRPADFRLAAPRYASLAASMLIVVGGYALVKGEVSEKLVIRRAVGLAPSASGRVARTALPTGLDDPRWHFAPKEESGRSPISGWNSAGLMVVRSWAEDLAGVLAAAAALGTWFGRIQPGSRSLAIAAAVYGGLFGLVLVRHSATWGYLSGRHTLSLALLATPWAAAGIQAGRRRVRSRIADRRWVWALRAASVVAIVGISLALQARQGHPSRWGYLRAGQWLAENVQAGETVLDTRGWASFVANVSAYDPWHIAEALRDPSLTYVVIGGDEIKAATRRGASFRALLDSAGTCVASYPARRDGRGGAIHIYRFWPRTDWEGVSP